MKITENNLKTAFAKLAKLCIDLETKGGPEHSMSLFEKVGVLQDDILEYFGLPSTPLYQSLLEFEKMPFDVDVDNLIEMLKKQSVEYKRFGAASELEQLKNSAELGEDDMTALPKIGVKTHEYTLWLYTSLLRNNKENAEDIFTELKCAQQNIDMLSDIYNLQNPLNYPDEQYEKEMKKYDEKGFKYWRLYIDEKRNEIKKMFGGIIKGTK